MWPHDLKKEKREEKEDQNILHIWLLQIFLAVHKS